MYADKADAFHWRLQITLGIGSVREKTMKQDHERLDTICFGGEDWWYHNRGHIDMQLMRRFAKRGRLIYVNSLVMQKPNVREGATFLNKVVRKSRSIFAGLKDSGAGFSVYSPFSLPTHHVSWLRGFNRWVMKTQLVRVSRKLGLDAPLIWVACPVAADVAMAMKRSKLVYQRTDRYEEFPGVCRETVEACDRRLKAAADLTVYVSVSLFEQERGLCRRAIFLDHGVDFEMFATAENDEGLPPDVAEVPKPIVGFYGGFAEHTTDVALLKAVIERLPNLSFVLVGKASRESEVLSTLKNVWMLGQRPYEQIPQYGKCFDVAIMPWKRNQWIQACNPIKLKEYLALGKPTVSTPFAQLAHYKDVVYEAEDAETFAHAIERALAEDSPEKIAARRNKVMNTTWDHKARTVLHELYHTDDVDACHVENVAKA